VNIGRIVVLNGASSAGKTSIARELQRMLPVAYLHVQLDAFRAMEPPGYFEGIAPELRKLRVTALCRALNATAAAYARHGQGVLLDHAVPPDYWPLLMEDFTGLPLVRVGVHCDPVVLAARECVRGDRPLGLAASQVESIHASRCYDLEVDTTACTPVECAQRIRAHLEDR
jgi:chloramphenicol 3-O phosphotransferase